MVNQLYLGDNLEVLRQLPSECVDMIYFDPPFFSNKQYPIRTDLQQTSGFDDRWQSIDHYLQWLKDRTIELYRILKPTGTAYLHCDWHANAYIRVQILDPLFGQKNFRNELIWHYETGGIPQRDFARKHDTIFRYTKSQDFYFNPQAVQELRSKEVLRRIATGQKSATRSKGQWRHPSDVIQIPALNAMAKERVAYPTQKPEYLLAHLLLASTKPNDLVLDPAIGSGTTLVAAHKLQRLYIGIDQNPTAIALAQQRLAALVDTPAN